MSHRGRLNVLANVLQKSYKRIFNEFAGEFSSDTEDGAGDVKYHLGECLIENLMKLSTCQFNRQSFSFRSCKPSCFRTNKS